MLETFNLNDKNKRELYIPEHLRASEQEEIDLNTNRTKTLHFDNTKEFYDDEVDLDMDFKDEGITP